MKSVSTLELKSLAVLVGIFTLANSNPASAKFSPTFNPNGIKDFDVESCLIQATRYPTADTASGVIPNPVVLNVTDPTDMNDAGGKYIFNADDYVVTLQKLKPKLPNSTYDAKAYLAQLGGVGFLSIRVTDKAGTLLFPKADPQKPKDPVPQFGKISIGNYNSVFYDLNASNMSTTGLVMIDEAPRPGTDPTAINMVAHCSVVPVY